jgi:uncharacterized 2Fe-2S/4Fe-4S cluster protein (DUF4445 family)
MPVPQKPRIKRKPAGDAMSAKVRIELDPLGIVLEADNGATLESLLAEYGVEFPCGASGICGGCRVQVLEGAVEPQEADLLTLTEEELAAGYRLACRIRASSPLKLRVEQWSMPILTDDTAAARSAHRGLAVAIDLGTTTIVAQLLDLYSGEVLGLKTALNPQSAYGADVMSRVRVSLNGPELTTLIRSSLEEMITDLSGKRASEIVEVVVVGNTVMHHIFSGIDCGPLAHVPFHSDHLGEQRFTAQQLGWNLAPAAVVRFLPCLGGFVGSDILAGILATGLHVGPSLRALVDLGTNGEIALGNSERILCASTAAGTAFEAGAIRMGMRAAAGAISHVHWLGDRMQCGVIGDIEPRGMCGSGLIDAVAAGLDMGAISPAGRMTNAAREITLQSPVKLFQPDVRELQLAKGAIAAGLRILLAHWGAELEDIECLYLAGAFGNYVRPESAFRIGLLEVTADRLVASGNTALRGAKLSIGVEQFPVLNIIEHVPLAEDPLFEDRFIQCMAFPAGLQAAAAHADSTH